MPTETKISENVVSPRVFDAIQELHFSLQEDYRSDYSYEVLGKGRVLAASTGQGLMIPVRRALAVAGALLLALAAPSFATEPAAHCRVNVTTCDTATCALLPGVGPAIGARIASAHPKSLEELDAVEGIGPAKRKAIAPLAAFGTVPTTCTTKQKGPAREKVPTVAPVTPREGGAL